ERIEIVSLERKHALYESETFARHEHAFQKMLHPRTQRDNIADTPHRGGRFEPVGIGERPHGKERVLLFLGKFPESQTQIASFNVGEPCPFTSKLSVLGAAVHAACDAADELVDELINDKSQSF